VIGSRGPGGDDAREIAVGLVAAVRAALGTVMKPHGADVSAAWDAACDVADLIELPGLSALLSTCRAHAAAPPRAVTNALQRLARLCQEARTREELAPFASADRELAAIAGTLSAQDWAETATAEPEAIQSLTELLAEFDVDDSEAVARAVVTLPVAAGLRAALDWIVADWTPGGAGKLNAELAEATFTLVTRAAHEPGLAPAGAVLALSGGALLPEPDGRWALRVPLHAARPAFLLVRQGDLSLALPWHAVVQLTIVDDTTRALMLEPSLAPWAPLARGQGERPAALLALGLRRAWVHLDHIVWRVFASPEPREADDAVPGGRRVVRTEQGGEYRVVELDEALAGVPPLHVPAPMPRPRAPRASIALVPGGEPAAARERAPAAAAAAAPEPAAPALVVLGPESVRPLGSGPAPAAATPEAESPAQSAEPGPRRALIVDDSLIARMELGRVLEREGWEVEWVETAGQMQAALRSGNWTAVFVDVFLPDAAGREHLRSIVERRLALKEPFQLVALTRDAAEEQLVGGTGITRVLRKPFAPGAVERVVRGLPTVQA